MVAMDAVQNRPTVHNLTEPGAMANGVCRSNVGRTAHMVCARHTVGYHTRRYEPTVCHSTSYAGDMMSPNVVAYVMVGGVLVIITLMSLMGW